MLRGRYAIRVGLAAGLAFVLWEGSAPAEGVAPASEGSGYVGAAACGECHPAELARWRGSHHARAMQVADSSTVLGDFDDASLTHFGVTSRFRRRDGDFVVYTRGREGKMCTFRVAYTFGIEPLQQYLVELPDGRVQALPFAWDTRAAAEGGQRWFHLYPDEAVPPGDPLHWTGLLQNWNHMCADCHSTNLRKGYDAEQDRFHTTWSEIQVSCEACHGPGARHVAWARRAAASSESGPDGGSGDRGLAVRFEPVGRAQWSTDPATGLPRRAPARRAHMEVETCGRCHARRSPIHEGPLPGRPLLDQDRVALLEEPLYYPDGQILDEVYVYGSFLQSRMYAAGVSCSDCHDPHGGDLRAPGNALCTSCHEAARFDASEHHHHPAQSAGARCVECHMPERTYMGIDQRRDHGIRVPRPDLSPTLGTPNACTMCHTEESDAWAAEAVAGWRGPERPPPPHWGRALFAGRTLARDAGARLSRLIRDERAPAIARATALTLLPPVAGPDGLELIESGLRDPSPLVRTAAVTATEFVDPRTRLRLAADRLADPVRSVRLEAVRVLAPVPDPLWSPEQAGRLGAALAEYLRAQEMDADRPEAHLRLGVLALGRGRPADAEAAFRRALELAPWFAPAAVDLADVYRAAGEDEKGEAVLRRALEQAPDDAALHHSLGLLLARRSRLEQALTELERAAELAPDVPRYAFVLAVALHEGGRTQRALAVLREASARHPAGRDIESFLRRLEAAPE